MTNQERIDHFLLAARHPCLWISTQEEQYALELVRNAAMSSGEPLWIWSVLRGVQAGLFENAKPIPNTEHPAAALYHFTNQLHEPSICIMLDLIGHLGDERTLRGVREAVHRFRDFGSRSGPSHAPEVESGSERPTAASGAGPGGSRLVLIDHADRLPSVVAAEAVKMELKLPSPKEIELLIRATLNRINRSTSARGGKKIEAKLPRRDLQMIIRHLCGLTRAQVQRIITDCVASDGCFDAADVTSVLGLKREQLVAQGTAGGNVLEYIEAPVSMDEIGGLGKLKKWLSDRRDSLSEEAAEFGLNPPRGILLLGVQGAGKSLAAKAVATAWQRPLMRLDPGCLYDRFIGESERKLRDALHQAQMMAPIVLWIDEIEKGFASAAAHSVDGGLSQRMFGTLLTWMQEHKEPVFMVATANNIEALPPELLRKGRFDEIFFVDLPDANARRRIAAIHLARRKRQPEAFDLAAIAQASEGFSGAEIEQAIISAMHDAFSAKANLDTERVVKAMRASPPLSVTMAERIQTLREWADGRCVPAD